MGHRASGATYRASYGATGFSSDSIISLARDPSHRNFLPNVGDLNLPSLDVPHIGRALPRHVERSPGEASKGGHDCVEVFGTLGRQPLEGDPRVNSVGWRSQTNAFDPATPLWGSQGPGSSARRARLPRVRWRPCRHDRAQRANTARGDPPRPISKLTIALPHRRRARDPRMRDAAGDGCSGKASAYMLLTGGSPMAPAPRGLHCLLGLVVLRGCSSLFAAIRLSMMGKKMGRRERLYRKLLILRY
jgi:hypothetical protein